MAGAIWRANALASGWPGGAAKFACADGNLLSAVSTASQPVTRFIDTGGGATYNALAFRA
jgi:hypothetical protein